MQGDRHLLKYIVEKYSDWKFSAIDGDPSLGDGVKCYATRHFNPRTGDAVVLQILTDTAKRLADNGAEVIRRKVERIIFDDRSSTVKLGTCNGACPECHLEDDALSA